MVMQKDGLREGREISTYLKTFEGAAATFAREEDMWSLWLPEMSAGERPITPASQLYFAVILRHEQQAFAIRFFYDCSTGKIRYYTSAVPHEIAQAPEFENAVSELFRHTLPVEPIRQRKLRKSPVRRRRERDDSSQVKPRHIPAPMADAVEPQLVSGSIPAILTPEEVTQPERLVAEQSLIPTSPDAGAEASEESRIIGVSEPSIEQPGEILADCSKPAPVNPVAKVEITRPFSPANPEVDVVPEPVAKEAAAPEIVPVETPAEAVSKPTQRLIFESAPSQSFHQRSLAEPEKTPVGTRMAFSKRAPESSREVAITSTREIRVAQPPERPFEPTERDAVRKVEFDVGSRMKSVLMSIIIACGIVATVGILAYSYLILTEDPGVKHHRLQNEALRTQASR